MMPMRSLVIFTSAVLATAGGVKTGSKTSKLK